MSSSADMSVAHHKGVLSKAAPVLELATIFRQPAIVCARDVTPAATVRYGGGMIYALLLRALRALQSGFVRARATLLLFLTCLLALGLTSFSGDAQGNGSTP